MPDFGSALWNKPAAADSTPDPVTRSLRLASGSSTGDSSSHLDRNSIGTPTDATKWTFSAWVKRSEITNQDGIFAGGTSSANYSVFRFRSAAGTEDNLFYDDASDGSNNYQWRWTPKLRDPSAWYNFMLVYDASQSAQVDKLKLYINGVLAPSASVDGGNPSSTHTMSVSKSGMNQIIGNNSVNDAKANLLIADVYFLDGVAKTVTGGVTDFTESNGYGGLKPKEYTGTDFGNNGFHIDAQSAHDADLLVSSIDRNDGDTLFADAAKGHTITKSGDPEHSDTVGNPFDSSGTAIYFDGSDDKLAITDSSDFAMGSGAFTYECWVYFHSLPSQGYVFGNHAAAGSGVQNAMGLQYKTSSNLAFNFYDSTNSLNYHGDSSGSQQTPNTTVSAGQWYHIACVRSGDTITYYKDGTSWGSNTLSSGASLVDSSEPIYLGTTGYSAIFLGANCSIFDFRITKGTARYTSNFTAPSAPFELNPVYIGGDQSGNKNHFAPTNISGHDILLDTPTKNYATLNPLQKAGTNGSDPSEGNLSLTGGSNPSKAFSSTIAVNSGKYYAEFYLESVGYPTVSVADVSMWVDGYGTGHAGRVEGDGVITYDIKATDGSGGNGQYYVNSTSATTTNVGVTASAGDIIQVAFDADTRKVWFGRNGTWNGSGNPTNGTNHIGVVNGTNALAVLLRSESGTTVVNFGQDPTFINGINDSGFNGGTQDTSQSEFFYAPPTDSDGNPFKSLNSSNLDAPSVTPSMHFTAKAYEGEGGGEEINLGFTPALTWIKRREDSGYWHGWYDSNRGLSAGALASNSTNTEDSIQRVASFDSDTGSEGFTLASGVYDYTNTSGKDFISWNWKAHQGGSTSYSNTLTLDVRDNYGYGSGWGTTKLEVWEGSTKLTDITNPPSPSSKIYNIKTNDLDKIKIVWYVDGSAGDWYNMYAVLKNSSNTTLASWDGNSWSGNSYDAPSDDDNFYLPSSFDSTNAATTGVVEAADADTERYNSSAGFTIIKYAGAGSSDGDTKTLDHSLGVPLEFVIAKARTSNDGYDNGDWIVWHKDLASSKYLFLNESYAQRTEVSGYNLISTTTSGTQHKVQVRNGTDNSSYNSHYLNSGPDNGTGEDYILYGWAGVEGFSKFGKYTGTGSATSPPFIYTGFEVGWLLTKNIDNGSVHWNLHDAARNPHNVVDERVWPNLSYASDSNYDKFDFYSNGFRPVTGDAGHNGTANTIIYAAFAESPFKYANAR